MIAPPGRLAALLALSGVAACSHVDAAADGAVHLAVDSGRAVHRAATGPHLAPIEQPPAMTPVAVAESGPNSLWRQGARTFFNDQRATRIGDILTVKVAINDSAEVENSTQRQRSGTTDAGVSSLFGKEEALGRLLPPGGNFDPENLVSAQAQSNAAGKGAISRQEKIELTLAATIAQVLSNGNLVVAGRQQVRINGELRELTVAGVVRPEDIAADNSIRHDQLAEARISYGGAGTLTAVQKPRWGQRVVDAVSPW